MLHSMSRVVRKNEEDESAKILSVRRGVWFRAECGVSGSTTLASVGPWVNLRYGKLGLGARWADVAHITATCH